MSLNDAVTLVLNSLFLASGGEIFVAKMPLIRISDLAHVTINHFKKIFVDINTQIVEIGTKRGEKLHEELMTDAEALYARESNDYFVIQPSVAGSSTNCNSVYDNPSNMNASVSYSSTNGPFLSQDEIYLFLLKNKLL